MLDQYNVEQLKQIILNVSPEGLIEWAEELNKSLTDPEIVNRYQVYMDGLRDYFSFNKEPLTLYMNYLRKRYTKEDAVEAMQQDLLIDRYMAKLYIERNWDC